MAATNGKHLIAKKYREKHGWEMPTLKLARIMYNENKLSFTNVDRARSALRYLEGKSNKSPLPRTPDRPKNPYTLPKSEAEPFEPFIMPYYDSVFVMNDIHLPYHDIDAVTAAIDYGVANKPKAVFLNGDILDFHGLSYFMKDPMKKRFSEELDLFADFMAKLNDIFKCKIYYKFGNHEERYDSFLYQKAHELVGVSEFKLEEIIKKRADCEVIRDKKIVIINGLPYIHGHEYGRGAFSPVNAARGLFLQAKHSAVKGDCHTTSEHTEPNIMGKINTTYSIGALCGLTPKWLPLNKWNHGCAMHFNSGEGVYSLENKRIYKGKIL
jgi:predicted phosphodiesterase